MALLEEAASQTATKSAEEKSVSAGPDAADVIAEGVELANPAAAAIAVVVVAGAGSSDRGADDGCANEAGADTPVQRLGLRLAGGRDRCRSRQGSRGRERQTWS